MRKGESGTNNLLDQQISAKLQRLLEWHSGDYDGLHSQRSGVQIQVSAKKRGVRSKVRVRVRVRVRGVNGTRVSDGARCMVRGVNRVRDMDRFRCMVRGVNRVRDRDEVRRRVRDRDRDGVRAGGGCAILFEKHLPPPKKVGNYLVGKN